MAAATLSPAGHGPAGPATAREQNWLRQSGLATRPLPGRPGRPDLGYKDSLLSPSSSPASWADDDSVTIAAPSSYGIGRQRCWAADGCLPYCFCWGRELGRECTGRPLCRLIGLPSRFAAAGTGKLLRPELHLMPSSCVKYITGVREKKKASIICMLSQP